MNLQVKVEIKIAKPVHEVFESIVDPIKLSNYFTTTASGPLAVDSRVVWTWSDYHAKAIIQVASLKKGKYISFHWSVTGNPTLVEIELLAIDSINTLVKVLEKGWESNEAGIYKFGQQTQGWTHMVTCMKAFLEYGINLRK